MLEVRADEESELSRLKEREKEMKRYIELLQEELDQRPTVIIEHQSANVRTAAAAADSQQVSSDQHPVRCSRTEQSDEKQLNGLQRSREKELKQYIELLQQELEKRCNEAVVSAAKWREVEAQLTDIHSSDTTDLRTSSAPLQQLEDEPEFKSENFLIFLFLFVYICTPCSNF